LQALDLPYEVNEGDGAFYGPKIDIKLRDALARSWQCATIKCDFTLPERFGLTYVDADGSRKKPVMIHRVVLGAIERFLGVLIEHYSGAFPLWLAPVQVIVLTITDRTDSYATEIAEKLREQDIRVDIDLRNEKIGFKIREARNIKIPYMVILGDKELENHNIAVRRRGQDSTISVDLAGFIDSLNQEIKTRSF